MSESGEAFIGWPDWWNSSTRWLSPDGDVSVYPPTTRRPVYEVVYVDGSGEVVKRRTGDVTRVAQKIAEVYIEAAKKHEARAAELRAKVEAK